MAKRCTIPRGFADNELQFPLVLFGISIMLCLPALQAMRSSHLSPAMGIMIIAAICSVAMGPWVYSEIQGRRKLRKLIGRDKEPKDP